MEITLKNGDKKHFDKAASCKDIALSISEGGLPARRSARRWTARSWT